VRSQEDRWRIQEGRKVGVPWTGCVYAGG
jgi:hypothetical protein